MRFKSLYPPVCVYGHYSKRWYVIADGKWNQVTRFYGWEELKEMWEKAEQRQIPEPPKSMVNESRYKVEGSKGNVYEVVRTGNYWTCSCPAHGFGRGKDCKHITQIKNKK